MGFPDSSADSRARLGFVVAGLQVAAFGVLPVLVTIAQFQALVRGHVLAVDFSQGPWVAGHRLFAGLSPYVGVHSPQLQGIAFVYPAAAALLLAPFSLLPHATANASFTLLSIAAALLTLRVLEVRDWRVYGVSLMWPAVSSGWETANITLLLGLGVALVWRYRDHPAVAGGLIALLISVKVFLWPLGLWLIATRRYRTLGYTAVLGLAINLISWWVVGFDQIAHYDGLLSTLTRNQENRGYSLVALVLNRGLDRPLAYAVMIAVSVLVAGACLLSGARAGGRAAFALSVATCLVATPMSWLHYFALLVIPLAIARPRLSVWWLLPLLLSMPTVGPDAWQTAIMFGLAATITVLVMSSEHDPQCLTRIIPRSPWAAGERASSP